MGIICSIRFHPYSFLGGKFSLLGSQFVFVSSWPVHVCMQQIEFHLFTDWNLSPKSDAVLFGRWRHSLDELNITEPEIFIYFLISWKCNIMSEKDNCSAQTVKYVKPFNKSLILI